MNKGTLGLKIGDRVVVFNTYSATVYTGVVKGIDPFTCSERDNAETIIVTLDPDQGRSYLNATVYFYDGILLKGNTFKIFKLAE